MKDLGAAKKLLGMEIQMDRKSDKLYLTQSRYLEKILDRFNMGNCKAVSTPLYSSAASDVYKRQML